jgi:hypothetical protein
MAESCSVDANSYNNNQNDDDNSNYGSSYRVPRVFSYRLHSKMGALRWINKHSLLFIIRFSMSSICNFFETIDGTDF